MQIIYKVAPATVQRAVEGTFVDEDEIPYRLEPILGAEGEEVGCKVILEEQGQALMFAREADLPFEMIIG